MSEITAKPIGEVVSDYLFEYGCYVNRDRAIPDLRDGLKPVHRRLLVTMSDLKLTGATMRKSAAVTGHALGNYHPHGDSSTYGALVGLYHRRYPLIAARGNWGIGNCGMLWENAAAYRYTECRLSAMGKYVVTDGDICDTQPNYDGTRQEPVVLASRLPLLLMNGTEGIGVAARTSIPPHNLNEIAKALKWMISKDSPKFRLRVQVRPAAVAHKISQFMPGPDYNTGILLSAKSEVAKMYSTGKGTLRYRCRYHFEEGERGKQLLVATSLAPGFHVPRFLTFCAEEAEAGHIIDASDESTAKHGVRVVVRFRDAGPVLDRIVPKLSTSVSYQLMTVKGRGSEVAGDDIAVKPCQHSMATLMLEYLDHQRIIEVRSLRRDIAKADKDRARLAAVIKAFNKLDDFAKLLRKKFPDDASMIKAVCGLLKVKREPAESLMRMAIRSLNATNVDATQQRIDDIVANLDVWRGDLNNIDRVLVRRLNEVVGLFGDDRGTELPGGSDAPELAADSPSKVMFIKYKNGVPHVTRPKIDGLTGIKQLFKGTRKIDADQILQIGDKFYLVYSDGEVRTVKWAYIRDGAHKEWLRPDTELLSIISDRDDIILAADDTGKVAVVKSDQRLDKYQIAKVGKLVSATGIALGEHAAVYENAGGRITPKGRYRAYDWWAKKVKRKGSLPSRVLPHARLCGLLRMPKGAMLLREDVSGRPIPVHSDPKRLSAEVEGSWLIYDESLIIFEDGRKRARPWGRVRNAIRRGENIAHILPMKAWEHTIKGELVEDTDEERAEDEGYEE